MRKQIQRIIPPDYKKIYADILMMRYPEKTEDCHKILSKKKLNSLDVILLNKIIFGQESVSSNPSHRSYDAKAILEILDHQKKYNLTNIQLAKYYKLSRNTVARWKNSLIED